MRKQEREELRRLEEALLEPEFIETPADERAVLEESWQEISDVPYDIYNTDEADVDLDAYSEDVHRGRRTNMLPVIITLLALIALSAMVLWLLQYLGVM